MAATVAIRELPPQQFANSTNIWRNRRVGEVRASQCRNRWKGVVQ